MRPFAVWISCRSRDVTFLTRVFKHLSKRTLLSRKVRVQIRYTIIIIYIIYRLLKYTRGTCCFRAGVIKCRCLFWFENRVCVFIYLYIFMKSNRSNINVSLVVLMWFIYAKITLRFICLCGITLDVYKYEQIIITLEIISPDGHQYKNDFFSYSSALINSVCSYTAVLS